jgi:hypothetical protein
MEPMQTLIDQMAFYICLQAAKLDKLRLQMFMSWLRSHSSIVRNTECARLETEIQYKDETGGLKDGLKLWFKGLSVSGLIWEYRLILTEIRWWRELDEVRLAKIVLECVGNNS